MLYQKQETYLLQNNAGQHPPTYLLQLVPCIRSKLQSRKENSTPISCLMECFMYKLETVITMQQPQKTHLKQVHCLLCHPWFQCNACQTLNSISSSTSSSSPPALSLQPLLNSAPIPQYSTGRLDPEIPQQYFVDSSSFSMTQLSILKTDHLWFVPQKYLGYTIDSLFVYPRCHKAFRYKLSVQIDAFQHTGTDH